MSTSISQYSPTPEKEQPLSPHNPGRRGLVLLLLALTLVLLWAQPIGYELFRLGTARLGQAVLAAE